MWSYVEAMSFLSPVLAIGGVGGTELFIILAIVLLLFGGAKLPSLARGMGQSIKEFKKAAKDDDPVTPEVKPVEAKKVEPANTHGTN
jgi:sec-independent protein translocase protein TatA